MLFAFIVIVNLNFEVYIATWHGCDFPMLLTSCSLRAAWNSAADLQSNI